MAAGDAMAGAPSAQAELDLLSPAGARLMHWAPAEWPVAPDWQPVLTRFLATPAARRLGDFIEGRLAAGAIVYPPEPLRALALTSLAQTRVVILGQDPYHGPGQAEGLAFSVAPGVRPPPSLRNIFKELARDPAAGPVSLPADGSLVRWAAQGVLLLNACLTVEDGRPAAHAGRGWEALTDDLLEAVVETDGPKVFMLWGGHAQKKLALLTARLAPSTMARHLILRANHPSPLSALRPPEPFIGCGHFGLANDFLVRHGSAPIRW